MMYTLNLFDIIPSEVDVYRAYSVQAAKVIEALGGYVVSSGWNSVVLKGEALRDVFIVVAFPDRAAIDHFLYDPQNAAMHELRERSTTHYIWKIFEEWNLKRWVAFPGMRQSRGT